MSEEYRNYNHSFKLNSNSIETIDEYQGEKDIVLACTQLDENKYPKQSQRKKILNAWIDFLTTNTTAIEKLSCTTRMNQQLFDALCCQENLTQLHIKWGAYPDLKKIAGLQKLKYLSLCAGTSTKEISAIGELAQLEVLVLSAVGVLDHSPIGNLHGLKQLGIHSGMDNVVTVNNLQFLYQLKELKSFHTTGFRLTDHDYSPVLSLEKLEYLSVNMPAYDHKIWEIRFAEQFAHIPYNAHFNRVNGERVH